MLSPQVSDWKDLSTSLKPIILHRKNIIDGIISDNKIASAAISHYKNNPVDFINHHVWTFDPRQKKSKVMPMRLFPKQEEYVSWLMDRFNGEEDGCVLKSRDMGISWINCAMAAYFILFHDAIKVTMASRKEMLVDRLGDMDSLLEKCKFILDHVPSILKQGQIDRFHLKILNQSNGSSITGEAGDQIGRGGRSTVVFIDEAAFIERPSLIDAALSQNSDVKIYVSTPNGVDNPFYIKCTSGAFPLFTFHWKDDPRKDDEWYEAIKKKVDRIILAREIDMDLTATDENITIPSEYVNAAVGLELPEEGICAAGLDVADGGGDLNAFIWRKGNVIKGIESWKIGDTTFSARKAYNLCIKNSVEKLSFDSIGVGAGIKGEMNSLRAKETGDFYVDTTPVNVGVSPASGFFCDSKKNKDMFSNLKAQLWWELRQRFEKTYEYVNGNTSHSTDDLISIPNDRKLILELSSPKYDFKDTGKLQIESKEKMKRRGIQSPNLADALVLCFYKSKNEHESNNRVSMSI